MPQLSSFINRWLSSKEVTGIQVHLAQDGRLRFSAVTIKNSGSRIQKAGFVSELSSAAELKKSCSVKIPVMLALTGKGIISRKIGISPSETDAQVLGRVIPSASPEEFYIQRIPSEPGYELVTVIRRSAADPILNEVEKEGYWVISLSIGPGLFYNLFPVLDDRFTGREVVVAGHVMQLGPKEINSFELAEEGKEGEKIHITGEEVLKPDEVLAYAAALGYYLPENVRTFSGRADQKNEEFKQRQIFQIVVACAVIFFLALLLGNFFFFSSYSSRYNELQQEVSAKESLLRQLDLLRAEADRKQVLVESAGLVQASRTSFYADRLAGLLAPSIKLTRLNIFPQEKRSDPSSDAMKFQSKQILVEGLCSETLELNEWMGIVKKQEWVKEVTMRNFSQDRSEKTGKFQIVIEIK